MTTSTLPSAGCSARSSCTRKGLAAARPARDPRAEQPGRASTKPIMNGGAYWHSDVSYKARPPIGSLLHGIEVPPEGGDTLYADMCGAYEALSDEMKARLAGLRATHSYVQRYEAMSADDPERPQLTAQQLAEVPAVSHPVVRTNPESGRKALYINEGFTVAIEGLPQHEGRALLDELFTHSTDERFRYRHRWQAGDLVIWDNRTTMHCATAYDRRHARNLHRTTIVGDVPV
ncbi:MAG: TauD/TfdA family dioxygenase [Burkholderiaceae bacterium]